MRMRGEFLRQRLGRAAGPLHAREQRAHAAHQQPGLGLAEDGAELGADRAQLRPVLVVARADQRAGDDVGMAVEVLGRRMHDDVGAVLDRPRQHRRRDRRIDRQQRAGLVRDLGRRGDVADRPGRVGRRLEPDQLGVVRAGPRRRSRRSGRRRRTRPSRPHCVAKVASQLRSDQYMTLGATTWSPGARARKQAVAALMPEEKISAFAPPSSAASVASA